MDRTTAINVLETMIEVAKHNDLNVMLLFSRREAIKRAIEDMKSLQRYENIANEALDEIQI